MHRFIRFYSQPSIANALKNADVALVYGTHSGNSKLNAQRLEAELQWRLNLKTTLGACDEFDFSTLDKVQNDKLLLLCLASYGQGGPTKNAQTFFQTVMGTTHRLENLQFSVFGRGSSAYAGFNEAAIAVDAKLSSLGAHRFAPYGQQDKLSSDTEEPYYHWKEAVVKELIRKYNIKEQPLVYLPRHTIHESPPNTTWQPKPQEVLASLALTTPERPKPEYAPATVKVHEDETGRKFVHATFDLSRTSQLYETGDYLVVWPTNKQQEVDIFLKAFSLDPLQIVTIDSKWTTTYNQLARHYVDINAKPNREQLKYFVNCAPNEASRAKLQEICDSQQQFETWIATHFNIGRVLLACSNNKPWRVPNTMILDVVPALEPRDYSISSSPLADSQAVSIGLVVETQNEWDGVASNFLLNIEPDTPVPVCTEMSTFKLPDDSSAPIVMIGIGTGTSPYRGFVEERSELKAAGMPVGDAYLFAGFRTPKSFQYADYFRSVPQLEVHTAYSRQGGASSYIQAVLKQQSEKIYDLINQGAFFYVCGSARLLKRHIRDTLTEIIAENEGISVAAAELQFKVLKRQGRIRQDVW